MNYTQTLDYLYSSLKSYQQVGVEAYKPGLERISEFTKYLGNPQRSFFAIHVAGTNGKGSVSHIIASVLQQAGYRTGLFTSPHLQDFRERIRVDGEMVGKQRVVNWVDKHRTKMEELGLSFFEMATAMAFDHFEQSEVEVAVIETGLGGRLDATNVLLPILSVITNIGLEHTAILGDTVEKIAEEKAGIIKKSIPVVIGQSDPRVAPIFEHIAEELRSDLIFAQNHTRMLCIESRGGEQLYTIERGRDAHQYTLNIDLEGDYQQFNIITAFVALDTLHRSTPLSISTRALMHGCRFAAQTTGLRGRWQVLSREPLVVCDAGHNPQGLGEVCKQLSKCQYEKLYVVFGVVNDKDYRQMLELLPKDAHYIFTQADSSRSVNADELADVAKEFGLQGEVVAGVSASYKRVCELAGEGDMIFIGGSTYVIAELPQLALESDE